MHKNWKFLHVALVVKDMDKAIKYFEALGIGPFPPFLGGPGMPFTGKTVWGKPSDYDMDLRLARGNMGGIGFELIQPLKGTPSNQYSYGSWSSCRNSFRSWAIAIKLRQNP